MSTLDKLGLGRKKKGYSAFAGERRKKLEAIPLYKRLDYTKIAISVTFLILIISIYPRTGLYEYDYEVGETWQHEAVTAPFTFSVRKSEEEIDREIREIRETTPPVFHPDKETPQQVAARTDSLFQHIQPVLDRYTDWQRARLDGTEDASEDSVAFEQARNRSGVGLDHNGWQALLESYATSQIDGFLTPQNYQAYVGPEIRQALEQQLERFYADGIIDQSKFDIDQPEIAIRDQQERTERIRSTGRVWDLREARSAAREQFEERFDEHASVTAFQLFNLVIEPNLEYQPGVTEETIEERIAEISHTRGAVSEGEVIIRRGDMVDQEKAGKLQSLAETRTDRAGQVEMVQAYVGESIVLISVFMIFFMYLYLYRKWVYENNLMFLLVFLIMGLMITASALIGQIEGISPYLVPVAMAPILLTIIFDSRVGLMATITVALITGFMHGNHFEYIMATIAACSMGLYSVRDIKNRSQLYLTTPFLVFISYFIVLLGFTLNQAGGWEAFTMNAQFVLLHAVGIWLTYPLILLLEKIFNITTDVTLLELSDTNRPILKEMMVNAPGTFHHSLQVANLAETATAAIGANSLLSRVGALYHDIGKLDKPEYFVENQSSRNAHERLKPRMSAMIIKNHVTSGVKMAEQEELPELIIDFIRTHHGTSLIKFFYDKALNQAGNENEIDEKDFRYDGPIPFSKETGILLLADSIEASSRAMKSPTYQKLHNLVHRIVDERVNEGQLNNCPITFQDLRIIKETFLKILVGIYHGRIQYPGQEEKDAAGKSDSPKTTAEPAQSS